jgi:DNA-binding response OmpR family regulator
VLVVHRDTLLGEAIAVVLAARPDVAEVTCAPSAAESLRFTDQGGFEEALVDLGLPKAELESLVRALREAGARVVGLAGTDAEAAAGRRAGVDAVGRAERPLVALLAELFPEGGSLPAPAQDDREAAD